MESDTDVKIEASNWEKTMTSLVNIFDADSANFCHLCYLWRSPENKESSEWKINP